MQKQIPLLILSLLSIFISCGDADPTEINCQTDAFFADTCVSFDLNELEITQDGIQFYITNNSNLKISFEDQAEAEKALEIIEHYQFDEYCILGEDLPFTYFLTNGQIPEGSFSGEDCLDHEVCDLSVELTSSGNYTVVNEGRWYYASASQDTALQILSTLQYFQSKFGCYVGRPDTEMAYIRK